MNSFSKQGIAESFSRAAATYDSFAHVQKRTASHLEELLPRHADISTILETGCGTGYYTSILSKAYPRASIFSLDVSFSMTLAARSRFESGRKNFFFTADAEHLPISKSTHFDIVTSNGVIQWFSDIMGSMRAFASYMHQDSTFIAAIFGRRTLEELAEAIHAEINPDAAIAAESFPDADTIAECVEGLFEQVEIRERTISRTYADVPSMLRALKMTGVTPSRSAPIIKTPGDIRRIEKSYNMRTGRVTASYHVILVKAWGRRQ